MGAVSGKESSRPACIFLKAFPEFSLFPQAKKGRLMGRLASFDAWAELPLKEVLVPPASTEGQREGFEVLVLPWNHSCSITVTTAGGRGSRREGHWARKFSSSRPLCTCCGWIQTPLGELPEDPSCQGEASDQGCVFPYHLAPPCPAPEGQGPVKYPGLSQDLTGSLGHILYHRTHSGVSPAFATWHSQPVSGRGHCMQEGE